MSDTVLTIEQITALVKPLADKYKVQHVNVNEYLGHVLAKMRASCAGEHLSQ